VTELFNLYVCSRQGRCAVCLCVVVGRRGWDVILRVCDCSLEEIMWVGQGGSPRCSCDEDLCYIKVDCPVCYGACYVGIGWGEPLYLIAG
jgi:hypothetical protein